MDSGIEQRLQSERAFHNKRFEEDTTDRPQSKYYAGAQIGVLAEATARMKALVAGKDALELGCANGQKACFLAPLARSMTGIDISDVAIANARKRAALANLDNVQFQTANAEALDFPDDSFDAIIGNGIIHHLMLEPVFKEMARVLRPGGTAFFVEPLGHNPAVNAYRAVTPSARTPDEHPLLKRDFKLAERYFSKVDLTCYEMTSLAAVPFSGTVVFPHLHRALSGLDRALFKIPGLRWWAWTCHMALIK